MPAFAVGGKQIGLVESGRIDALAGLDLAHRPKPVAVTGGALEIQRVGGLVHFRDQPVLHAAAFAGEKAFGFLHQLAIARLVDASHAGRAAALDLEQQAGPGARGEHRIRAGAQQKGALQRIEGAGDRAGAGERPEIDSLGGLGAAMLEQLRKGMILAQQDVGKALVVAIGNIVARLELLDEIGFQQQRFGFGRGGDEQHLRRLRHHAGQAVAVHPAPGIGGDALLQALGLADIKHIAGRVQHAIDAGRSGRVLR